MSLEKDGKLKNQDPAAAVVAVVVGFKRGLMNSLLRRARICNHFPLTETRQLIILYSSIKKKVFQKPSDNQWSVGHIKQRSMGVCPGPLLLQTVRISCGSCHKASTRFSLLNMYAVI